MFNYLFGFTISMLLVGCSIPELTSSSHVFKINRITIAHNVPSSGMRYFEDALQESIERRLYGNKRDISVDYNRIPVVSPNGMTVTAILFDRHNKEVEKIDFAVEIYGQKNNRRLQSTLKQIAGKIVNQVNSAYRGNVVCSCARNKVSKKKDSSLGNPTSSSRKTDLKIPSSGYILPPL